VVFERRGERRRSTWAEGPDQSKNEDRRCLCLFHGFYDRREEGKKSGTARASEGVNKRTTQESGPKMGGGGRDSGWFGEADSPLGLNQLEESRASNREGGRNRVWVLKDFGRARETILKGKERKKKRGEETRG